MKITIEVQCDEWLTYAAKGCEASGISTVEELLTHLAYSAADGARRPGAWERGWLEQATGFAPRGRSPRPVEPYEEPGEGS